MAAPTGVEIERKFLPTRVPDGLPEGERIEQGYLAVAPDGVEVRVRRRAGRATLTIKSGPAQVRTEEELEIDDRRFESLWPLTAGRRIDKIRHVVPLPGGLAAEVDVYAARTTGCSSPRSSSRRRRPARASHRPNGSGPRSPATRATRTSRSRSAARRGSSWRSRRAANGNCAG